MCVISYYVLICNIILSIDVILISIIYLAYKILNIKCTLYTHYIWHTAVPTVSSKGHTLLTPFFRWISETRPYENEPTNDGTSSLPCQPALNAFSLNHTLEWEQKAPAILGGDCFCFVATATPSVHNRSAMCSIHRGPTSQEWRSSKAPASWCPPIPHGAAVEGRHPVVPSTRAPLPQPRASQNPPSGGRSGCSREGSPSSKKTWGVQRHVCVSDTGRWTLHPWAGGKSPSWKGLPSGTHLESVRNIPT